MSNVCDHCGQSNRPTAMFCIGCTGKLPGFAPSGPSALEAAKAMSPAFCRCDVARAAVRDQVLLACPRRARVGHDDRVHGLVPKGDRETCHDRGQQAGADGTARRAGIGVGIGHAQVCRRSQSSRIARSARLQPTYGLQRLSLHGATQAMMRRFRPSKSSIGHWPPRTAGRPPPPSFLQSAGSAPSTKPACRSSMAPLNDLSSYGRSARSTRGWSKPNTATGCRKPPAKGLRSSKPSA